MSFHLHVLLIHKLIAQQVMLLWPMAEEQVSDPN